MPVEFLSQERKRYGQFRAPTFINISGTRIDAIINFIQLRRKS